MPEGVEVRPENLRRGAGLLRDDAGRVHEAGGRLTAAAGATASAAGDGPLAGAADAFAARVEALLRAVTSRVLESADALDAASVQYRDADRSAAADLGGDEAPILLPGLEPPR